MRYYILDIETRPDGRLVDLFNQGITAPSTYKDEEKIKQYIEKKKTESKKAMSVDTDYLDIACFGIYDVEADEAKVYETEELEEQINKIALGGRLVTFNGKKFDIPAIMKYGIKNDLLLPYSWLKRACRRYDNILHVDLVEELGEYNKYRSLDEYLKIYLNISKKEIDFETCTHKELKEHCLEDIVNTYKLYNNFLPFYGQNTQENVGTI